MARNDTDSPPNTMEDVEVDEENRPRPPRHGDDNDEELPQRRQHKYTTANLQPERPWKRWFLICLAFLVVIAIMILLSIFLKKLFDPPEEEDWSDDKASALNDDLAGVPGEVSGTPPLLPKDVAFLDDVCAEDKLNGDAESRAACEDACAPAKDCCNPFSSGNSTCFEQQVAGCVVYSQCHALDGFSDPAWNDLHRLCSPAGIETNRQDCVNACQSMECCYKDTDSCIAEKFQACLDYAPCQNLRLPEGQAAIEESSIIATAPAGLDDECRDQDAMCARDCREATCCSDPNSACYRDNFVACLTYATCNQHVDSTTQVTIAPINAVIPKAPATLNDMCLSSKVNTTGTDQCREMCTVAQCCWEDGANGCFGNDPLGCLQYRMCANVQ